MLRYAAKENLKADFRVEGNPFGSVTIRNLHAFAVGPSEYESIDVDYLYLDYSLFGFARHGLPRLFNDVEARSANIVLNPSKKPLRPRPPHPRLKLPRFFPERLRATDTTVIVRNQPYDFVVGHADLELNPRTPGRAADRDTATSLWRYVVENFRPNLLHEQEFNPARPEFKRSGAASLSADRCIANRRELSCSQYQLHRRGRPIIGLCCADGNKVVARHEATSDCPESCGGSAEQISCHSGELSCRRN